MAYNTVRPSRLIARPKLRPIREGTLCMAFRCACLLLLVVSLTACSRSLVPKLKRSAATPPAAALAEEGKIDEETQTARFSVPPQQLAALIIKTAKSEGWAPKQKAVENDDRWVVTVRNPDKPLGRSEQNVFVEADPGGGSTLRVGAGVAALPAALLGPLKANVATHYQPPKRVVVAAAPESASIGKKSPGEVVVTKGTPMRPYRRLGKVRSSVRLNEKTLKEKILDAPFAWMRSDEEKERTSETRLFNILSANALRKYGSQVDAIIKARYKTRTDGSAFASGLAVQYVAAEERLEEIQRLHEKGYLTDVEYEERRARILDGL